MKHIVATLKFPLILGLLGFVFSSRRWILFLNNQSPFIGLFIYYTIILFTILFLQNIGLVVADVKFDSIQHALGTLLILFSFFIIFDWESLYISQVTNHDEPSNVYLQSEDGVTYYFFYNILGLSIEHARIMTFVISPIILTTIGLFLIRGKKIQLSPF